MSSWLGRALKTEKVLKNERVGTTLSPPEIAGVEWVDLALSAVQHLLLDFVRLRERNNQERKQEPKPDHGECEYLLSGTGQLGRIEHRGPPFCACSAPIPLASTLDANLYERAFHTFVVSSGTIESSI